MSAQCIESPFFQVIQYIYFSILILAGKCIVFRCATATSKSNVNFVLCYTIRLSGMDELSKMKKDNIMEEKERNSVF